MYDVHLFTTIHLKKAYIMNQEQSAKCVLKLNTPVLNALFPEGTEARVELVNAALTEVASTYVKSALSAPVQDYLRGLTNELNKKNNVDEVVKKYFENNGGWNSVTTLKPGTKLVDALSTAVQNAFIGKFHTLLEEQIELRVKEYTDKLDSRVEYAVKQRIDRLTTDAIQARVDAAVNAARAAL
jgi:hypothetical protein